MSGAENGNFNFEWFVSLGNLLSVIISGTVVVGAIIALIRYLKKNVTAEVVSLRDSMNRDMIVLSEKVSKHEETTERGIERTINRMNEVKEMISILDKRIDEVKNDTNKRIDQRAAELAKLVEKLDELKEEYYKLKVEIVRKIDIHSEVMGERIGRSEAVAHKADSKMRRHLNIGDSGGRPHGEHDDDESEQELADK